MASIQDRWRRRDPATGRLVPTELDGKGLRYRPQFRDPSGRQIMKGFALKRDAQRWLDDQTAHIARGTYVAPGAGRTTFAEFYADWSSRQVWAPGTVLAMNLAAGSVPFADIPLRVTIQPGVGIQTFPLVSSVRTSKGRRPYLVAVDR